MHPCACAGLCFLRVSGHWADRLRDPEPEWQADRQQVPHCEACTAAGPGGILAIMRNVTLGLSLRFFSCEIGSSRLVCCALLSLYFIPVFRDEKRTIPVETHVLLHTSASCVNARAAECCTLRGLWVVPFVCCETRCDTSGGNLRLARLRR